MKNSRELTFPEIQSPEEAVRYLLRVRFAECLSLQHSLFEEDDGTIHAFRLSCKRLRYAIERLDDDAPELRPVGKFLTQMADELGFAHDCVVLAKLSLSYSAPLVAQRAKRDRADYITRARRLWRRAFRDKGTFSVLAAYTGFKWELPAP